MVFTLDLLSQVPLIVKVCFPLNLNFLNFSVVGLDELFAALDFGLHLVPQLLNILHVPLDLLFVGLVVLHQLRLLRASDLFHGFSLHQLLFCFTQLLIEGGV